MKYAVPVASLTLVVSTLAFQVTTYAAPGSSEPFVSVELGLAELSPRGEAGGYAMPASGASVNLSYRQTGDSNWKTAVMHTFSDDRAIDLKWDSQAGWGGSTLDSCQFTEGYKAPSGVQATDDTSLGSSLGRILSGIGGFSIYTISCNDAHNGSGHSGGAYTVTDTVILANDDATQCSDGIDNDGDGYIDYNGGITIGADWIQGTGSCSYVCSSAGEVHTPDSRGNMCSSGEAVVKEAIDQLGTGILIYGCWGGACPNGINFSNTYEFGSGCYYPGQKVDSDATDRTIACPCGERIIYSDPDPDCTGPLDDSEDSDSPTATIEVRNVTDGVDWTGDDLTVDETDNIDIRWSSTNATSCSGSHFVTGSATNGTDLSPDLPLTGQSLQYFLSCTDGTETAYDWLTLNTTNCIPSIDVDQPFTYSGDAVNVSWDANCGGGSVGSCVVSGPGLNISPLTSGTGSQPVTIFGEATFAIDCRVDKSGDPSGSLQYDSATVKVLPKIEET